jgi:hypothetical protein
MAVAPDRRSGRIMGKSEPTRSAWDDCDLIVDKAGETRKKAFEGLLGGGWRRSVRPPVQSRPWWPDRSDWATC